MAVTESIPDGVGNTSSTRQGILITVPRWEMPGGVTNFCRLLRKYWRRDSPVEKRFFEVGCNPRQNLFKRLAGDYWRFHRLLAKGDVRLVHLNPSMNGKAVLRDWLFLLVARLHSVRCLVLVHGWENRFCTRLRKSGLCWLFVRLLNGAEAIIVLAADYRQQLRAMGVTAPISLGTTCVDDDTFRHRADPSGRRLDILYLSRLVPEKGLELAIRAFRRLDNATLTIAGDGPCRASQEKLVADLQLRNVRFIGHVEGEEKRRAYTRANVFFFPTLCDEGMPTTVLEAMAYGLPVVTRSVGGLKDFFTGRMGYMTPSRSDRVLASLLQQLTPEVRKQMGDYNRRYAREHFAASRAAQKLEFMYGVLGEGTAGAYEAPADPAASEPAIAASRVVDRPPRNRYDPGASEGQLERMR